MGQITINREFEIILELLKQRTHGRELSTYLDIPLTTVQRTLKDLEEADAVDYAIKGRNKVYQLKNNLQAKAKVLQAESYKLLKLLKQYPHLQPTLEDLQQTFEGNIILFGSYAKFSANKQSDIDIFIDTKERQMKTKVSNIHSRLSIKIGRLTDDDYLSKEIHANHVILRGAEAYHEQFTFQTSRPRKTQSNRSTE